jgi:hypothetical protein
MGAVSEDMAQLDRSVTEAKTLSANAKGTAEETVPYRKGIDRLPEHFSDLE